MTTSSDLSPEVDEVLTRLSRVVRRASEFILGFVKCNSPIQQREMSRLLSERLSEKRSVEITLDEPIISLLDKLKAVLDVNDPPAFVNVFGLGKSIYAQEDYSPVLGRLNNDRDLIRRACPAVLLIWLPDYALDKMVLSAPDFWAWRSGVYEFPTDKKHWQSDSTHHLYISYPEMFSLTLEEKQQEITRLEELLRIARAFPRQEKREKEIVARLSYQSGMLWHTLGDLQKAKTRFEESQQLLEGLNNPSAVAAIAQAFAMLEEDKGNLDEARRLYERSLNISRELNDAGGVAVNLRHLGTIIADEGDLVTARSLLQQSLHIFEQLIQSGSEPPASAAGVLLGLGNIHSDMREWEEAEGLYQRVSSLAEATGQKGLQGIVLHQLGGIKHAQGDLDEAIRLCEASLQIGLGLGDKHAIAFSLAQLGELKLEKCVYREAFDYLTRALTLLEDLEAPHAKTVLEWLDKLRSQVGVKQFQQWMQDARRSQHQTLS